MPVEKHLGKLWSFSYIDLVFTLSELLFLLISFIIFSSIMSLVFEFSIMSEFISLNMLFVSPRCFDEYRILLIAKNTLLLKAFTSKNGMLSDVIVTVYLKKCTLLCKCELSIGLV